MGFARLTDPSGQPTERQFPKIADIGFGGEPVQYVNSHSKRLGGQLSFLLGLLVVLISYQNKSVSLRLEPNQRYKGQVSSIIVANGQYFGGGM